MPRSHPKIRCENPCCSKTDFRSIAIGSYKVDSIPLPNPATRFIYNGKMSDGMEGVLTGGRDMPGMNELDGDLLFLCKKCKEKLKICHMCDCEKCICKDYY
jgi:hypothetical protein